VEDDTNLAGVSQNNLSNLYYTYGTAYDHKLVSFSHYSYLFII